MKYSKTVLTSLMLTCWLCAKATIAGDLSRHRNTTFADSDKTTLCIANGVCEWSLSFWHNIQQRDRKSIRRILQDAMILYKGKTVPIDSLFCHIHSKRMHRPFKKNHVLPVRLEFLCQHPLYLRYYVLSYVVELNTLGKEDLRMFVILDNCDTPKPVPLVVAWQEISKKPLTISDFMLSTHHPNSQEKE